MVERCGLRILWLMLVQSMWFPASRRIRGSYKVKHIRLNGVHVTLIYHVPLLLGLVITSDEDGIPKGIHLCTTGVIQVREVGVDV